MEGVNEIVGPSESAVKTLWGAQLITCDSCGCEWISAEDLRGKITVTCPLCGWCATVPREARGR